MSLKRFLETCEDLQPNEAKSPVTFFIDHPVQLKSYGPFVLAQKGLDNLAIYKAQQDKIDLSWTRQQYGANFCFGSIPLLNLSAPQKMLNLFVAFWPSAIPNPNDPLFEIPLFHWESGKQYVYLPRLDEQWSYFLMFFRELKND